MQWTNEWMNVERNCTNEIKYTVGHRKRDTLFWAIIPCFLTNFSTSWPEPMGFWPGDSTGPGNM